jgi:hypothetical protein
LFSRTGTNYTNDSRNTRRVLEDFEVQDLNDKKGGLLGKI